MLTRDGHCGVTTVSPFYGRLPRTRLGILAGVRRMRQCSVKRLIANHWFRGIIRGNIKMRFCFMAAMALAGTLPALEGSSIEESAVSSVVRADARTGRLVRRIVVPSQMVASHVIAPRSPAEFHPAPLPQTTVNEIVDEVCQQYGVDPLLAHAVIYVESSYNRFALSPKGAQGLMQLIPATARRFGVRNSFDSRQNIEGGVKYLRFLLDRFSDLRHVFAAYNAGEEAVSRYRGIPPYQETQEYVYRAGKRLGELRRRQKQAPPAPVQVAARQAPVPEYRPLETFVDAEGRLHLRTR
ncbi:MAG: lytic transglycosylase domain-containing protein [Acidobacteriia bacterium]|nr:lytic transglycosylase domain-containing protein [Terriglobia bacterium]